MSSVWLRDPTQPFSNLKMETVALFTLFAALTCKESAVLYACMGPRQWSCYKGKQNPHPLDSVEHALAQ